VSRGASSGAGSEERDEWASGDSGAASEDLEDSSIEGGSNNSGMGKGAEDRLGEHALSEGRPPSGEAIGEPIGEGMGVDGAVVVSVASIFCVVAWLHRDDPPEMSNAFFVKGTAFLHVT